MCTAFSVYQQIVSSQYERKRNINALIKLFHMRKGWSGGAMVLGKLPVPGRPTNLD